ncbi:tetratricopeptide repeat protein [Mycolicibacterium sp. P1-18]|uniref:tetratricopeptide repeat protein n=1 Tax=Mycolicibacterium sp. P1-18 TaxID=2024615 RepID=UPI0015648D28|nr:tetratricopeptide repeat protein [Mycolicibacterium sp. P1-18]
MTAAGDTDGVIALATAYADARNHARAEEVLRDALVTAPDNAVLLANLARVQILTRQYDAATRNAYAALAISPEYGFAMRIYAVALDAAGWVDQALCMAWRGVAAQPHDRLAHFVYAEMLM